MVLTLVLLFATALLAVPLSRFLKGQLGLVLTPVPLALFVYYFCQIPLEFPAAVDWQIPWIPALGVELAFRLDGLSSGFAVLVTGIGTLVVLYAGGYLAGDPRLGRFYAYLLAFMGAMLGLILADDLVLMFVFWELTSVCSYLLIGFNHESEDSRASALKALVVTGAGGLALLGGVLLLGIINAQLGAPAEEMWRISKLGSFGDLRSHPLYTWAALLLFFGAFTKSAQFPFHFWLPAAMAAPTPVSAFLHSATMVKAGIYLLARLHPILGGTDLWAYVVTTVGAVTMVVAAVSAACQIDLKRILAFSTVSVLGMLVMLLGPGTEECIRAAVVLLVAHAFYKAALFMVAGNIDHETGTRDITRLGGLRRVMPLTAFAGVLAAFSNMGAPPLFGFLGKELLYVAKLDLAKLGHDLVVFAVVANVFLTAAALMVAVWPFFGPAGRTPRKPHEAPWTMLVGPVLLASVSLLIGLWSGPTYVDIGSEIAATIAGHQVEMKLRLWHGFNPEAFTVLGLSIVTLAIGFVLFLKLHDWLVHLAAFYRRVETRWGAAALYEYSLAGLQKGAKVVTKRLQSGYLSRYLTVVAVAMVAVTVLPLWASLPLTLPRQAWVIRIHEVAIAVLILGGAIAAVFSPSRLAAIVALGVTGLGMTLLFGLFSAPDLAITQVLIESLTVILFILVFWHLPPYTLHRTPLSQGCDTVVAVLVGAVMTTLVLICGTGQLPSEAAQYFLGASQPEAHGRNVVNAILVDFRGIDTLGETVVVATAGIGVFALLRHGLVHGGRET